MTVLISFVSLLCQLLIIAIILRAILSWFALNPRNPVNTILYQITEPILAPLRRIVPRIGMLDITPLIAIILLQLIVSVIPR